MSAAVTPVPFDEVPVEVPVEVPAPDDRPTGRELAESMTGWDELAIEAHIGKLGELSQTMTERAMCFVLLRRKVNAAGVRVYANDAEAKRAAFDLSLADLRAMFREDTEGEEQGKA